MSIQPTRLPKKQKIVAYRGTASSWFSIGGVIYPPSVHNDVLVVYTTQTTLSSGTPWLRKDTKKFKGSDIGGGFFTTKSLIFPPQEIDVTSGAHFVQYGYKGPYTAHGFFTNVELEGPSQTTMDAFGTSSIARALPTNPLAGMGQFIGELRDLPKLPYLALMKRKANSFREISKAGGSEYLNVVFGWVPFVNDLLKLSQVVAKHKQHVEQYDRDSGRLIRRRLTLMNESSTSVEPMGDSYGYPALELAMYSHPGKLTKTVTTTQRVWFSGAFTYYFESGIRPASSKKGKGGRVSSYIPPGSDSKLVAARNRQIASKLYGLRLDPFLLYQLFPWSWALDWVTNAGSVARNIVAFQNDGLVMKYGYVMCMTRTTTMYSLDNVGFTTGGDRSFVDVHVQVTKTRTRATPYGFGLNPESFGPRKLAIIAALGLSRGQR